MQAFHKFSQCSELEDNQAKSQVMRGGCGANTRKLIMEIIGFSEGDLPLRYLRVPIIAGKLSKMKRKILVEKIAVKIKYWTTRTCYMLAE